VLVHAAAILLALLFGGPVRQFIVQPRAVALITAPPPVKRSIQMRPRPIHTPQRLTPPHPAAFKSPVAPAIRAPVIELSAAPMVEQTRVVEPAPELPQIRTRFSPPVKTGDFASVAPANPARTLQPPVQTSVFNTQENAQAATRRSPLSASGFDSAGVAEAHRTPAAVSQSGFSAPTPATSAQSAPHVMTNSGFGDAASQTPVHSSLPQPRSAPSTTPAEILSKPRPAYTEEARTLAIEGEVLVEVVLEPSGKVRIVRLVKGLGHGLDENAQAAAREIRFRPALKEGVPADSTAVVHILFQLAY
jgi:TonB family protein